MSCAGFWLLFVLLTVAYIVPIWQVDIFPSTDLYGHMAVVSVVKHLGTAQHFFRDYFMWGIFPYPNTFFYVVTALLSVVMDIFTATRVMLSLYVVMFPLCFYIFLRGFGRSRWLALFGFLAIYDLSFLSGYIDYAFSVPWLFLGLASSESYARQPSQRGFWLTAGIAILLFFTHVQSFAIYCVLAAVLMVLHGRWQIETTWQQMIWREGLVLLRRWATLLPALLFFLPWFVRHFVLQRTISGRQYWPTLSTVRVHFDSWEKKFTVLYDHSFNIFRGDEDMIALVLILLVAAIRGMYRTEIRPARRLLYGRRLEWLAIGMLLFYLLLPSQMTGQEVIYNRLATSVWLFFCAWWGGRWGISARWVVSLGVTVVAAILFYHAHNLSHYMVRFQSETNGVMQVLRAAPRHSRLVQMVPVEKCYSQHFNIIRLWHLNQLHYLLNEGVTHDNFIKAPGRIVELRPNQSFGGVSYVADWYRNPAILGRFAYILVHYHPSHDAQPHIQLVKRSYHWALYKVRP
jgi:hypothetical protein